MKLERDTKYDELRRRFERDPEYWVEYLKLVFSEDVGRLMDERGVNQAELARRLDTSRAYVTRLFRGTFNPTVETLVKVALALDARVALHLHPRLSDVHWLEAPRAVETPEATRATALWANADRQLTRLPATTGRADVISSSAA